MSAQIIEDREGTRTVQISDRDGMAIMHFERPVKWCALDPVTGMRFAETFAKACYKVMAGDTPTPSTNTQLADQVMARLANRYALMLRTFVTECPAPDEADFKVWGLRLAEQAGKELL